MEGERLNPGPQHGAGRGGTTSTVLVGWAQLVVRAIDARLKHGRKGFLVAMIRGARWELTCGFCKERFRTLQHLFSRIAECPHSVERELLHSGGPEGRTDVRWFLKKLFGARGAVRIVASTANRDFSVW